MAVAAVSLLFLAGCKKDEEGALQIVFRATYSGQPLQMLTTQDYAGGQKLQFTRSEFFASDIRLVGNDRELSNIELIDLSFTNANDANRGLVLTFNDIPAGTYSDLAFGFGVASDINATVPTDYPSSSPLSNTGRYWVPWSSYIFSKTEGNLDTVGGATFVPHMGFAYHTGANNLYRDLRINSEITIRKDATTRLVFYVDHAALLGLPASPLDIKSNPQNHSPEEVGEIQAIVNNLLVALTYLIE